MNFDKTSPKKTQPATAKNFPQRNGKTSPTVRENRPTGNTAKYSVTCRNSRKYVLWRHI